MVALGFRIALVDGILHIFRSQEGGANFQLCVIDQVAAPRGLALQQSQDDAERAHDSAHKIRMLGSWLCGRRSRPRIVPQITCTHVVNDVWTVSQVGGVRAGAAHAFDADQDACGIELLELRIIEAPFFQHAQAEIFYEDIGLPHQLLYELAAFGRLHIHGEGLLAALEFYEIRLLVPQLRVLAPVTIAAQPRLAADDFGAELAQHAPDRRSCRSGRQLDNANTLQR